MKGSTIAFAAVFLVLGVASVVLELWFTAIAMAIGFGGLVYQEWKRRRPPESST
ncbi:hypothetical protein [Actinotalea subterranea]|uniref:hypothetical protein n=1 Tax=Actinotalea subterranea TaxID=2607497 RepID=UPI00165DD7E4|nr:hypothetical protein [Actinotalea subterranea]